MNHSKHRDDDRGLSETDSSPKPVYRNIEKIRTGNVLAMKVSVCLILVGLLLMNNKGGRVMPLIGIINLGFGTVCLIAAFVNIFRLRKHTKR